MFDDRSAMLSAKSRSSSFVVKFHRIPILVLEVTDFLKPSLLPAGTKKQTLHSLASHRL